MFVSMVIPKTKLTSYIKRIVLSDIRKRKRISDMTNRTLNVNYKLPAVTSSRSLPVIRTLTPGSDDPDHVWVSGAGCSTLLR